VDQLREDRRDVVVVTRTAAWARRSRADWAAARPSSLQTLTSKQLHQAVGSVA
jgi:hypothetical protein